MPKILGERNENHLSSHSLQNEINEKIFRGKKEIVMVSREPLRHETTSIFGRIPFRTKRKILQKKNRNSPRQIGKIQGAQNMDPRNRGANSNFS